MQNAKCKIIINFLVIFGLVLPSFCLAQNAQAPETLEGAKVFGIRILEQLPEAVKKVWQEEALPLWQKMWNRIQELWNTYIWPKINPWWQEKKPTIEEEFQKEKEEMEKEIQKELPKVGKPLWVRFKELLK